MSVAERSSPLLPALRTWVRRRINAPKFRLEDACAPTTRQLLVDVSVIVSGDAGTGIQRVVRSLVRNLKELESEEFTVQPIYATRDHRYCRARIEPDGVIAKVIDQNGKRQAVNVRAGDIYLGLDLAAHLIPHLERDLELWRKKGVRLAFLVYDLLPVLRPDWFPPKTPANMDRWLGVLARQADQCICISNTVAADLEAALKQRTQGSLPSISTIPLGWDLGASNPSRGLPANINAIRAWLDRHRTILAVGTIEPRKGYDQLLNAMSLLWARSPSDITGLLVIGRRGWKTEALQERLLNHPEHGKRLMWLAEASDELLEEIYQNAAGLVAASHGEGFGLPLIEALANGIPVLARDIPVFREIGGDRFEYFDAVAPEAMCEQMAAWLDKGFHRRPLSADCLPRWADSAQVLAAAVGLIQATEDGARP